MERVTSNNILHKLLEIFPEEIWGKIIENSNDRQTILLGLPNLRTIFYFQVPKWLFGKALSSISDYLSVNDVLNCRQTCKLWHLDIHRLLSSHPYYQPYNKVENSETALPKNTAKVQWKSAVYRMTTATPVLCFRTPQSIDSFFEMSTKANFLGGPIFGNILYLHPSANSTNPREIFVQKEEQLLNTFGNFVWHLILTTHRKFETAVKFYKRLRLILQLTPNLKSLTVYFGNHMDTMALSLLLTRQILTLPPSLQYVRFDGFPPACNIFSAILSLATRQESNVRKIVLPFLLNCSYFKDCRWSCLDGLKVTELEIITEGTLPSMLNKLSGLERFATLKRDIANQVGSFHWINARTTLQYMKKLIEIPSLQKLRFRTFNTDSDIEHDDSLIPDEKDRCYNVMDIDVS